MIPYVSFDYINNIIRSECITKFEEFFDSKWYVLGKEVEAFEKEYAAFNNTKYSIGVSNGLDALHLSLKALNIGKGDEVIVPSNTFIATALAVTYVGANIFFVEPDASTYLIDPDLLANSITSKTKAIIPVHLYGQACNMDTIMKVSAANNLYIIEDNAQSQGARWKGQLTGSFGIANATSFYPAKNIGAFGDAGAITSDDEHIIAVLRKLRNYGSIVKYQHELLGHNNRIDELQAAFLRIKLKYLNSWNQERQNLASIYDNLLKDIEGVQIPVINENATSVYHIYMIQIEKRNKLQDFLNSSGIGTLIHYPIPPHLQKCYAHLGLSKGQFPIAEQISEKCLSLPLYPGLSIQNIEKVCSKIKEFYGA